MSSGICGATNIKILTSSAIGYIKLPINSASRKCHTHTHPQSIAGMSKPSALIKFTVLMTLK